MSKISCKICNAQEHVMQKHLEQHHPDVSIEQYQARFPGEPILSALAQQALDKRLKGRAAAAKSATSESDPGVVHPADPANTAVPATVVPKGLTTKRSLHEVFDLGKAKAAMSVRGEPIPISVMLAHEHQDMVPAVSDHYVYDISELKNVILGLELAIPCLVWGHKGSGKSELLEQACARTNRPMMRIQHTVNTEESHITGQWTVKAGQTEFELGPLPMAMQFGWVYCADEYDFGMPSVLSVYQSVLEGKALVIKEAPAAMRVIRPHPNFRFVATGNTNGSGDETGLYQGTLIQNSANYDRFGIVINKKYMDRKAEAQILQNHCKLTPGDAEKMVDFATQVRQAYDGAKISDTISPRTLIYAAKVGVMRGSFREGLMLSFINKLCKIDREVADGLAQRVFG